MLKLLVTGIIAIGVFTGCGVSSAVTEVGPNKYLVSSQVALCISCAPAAQSIKTAKAYCEEQGKKFEMLDSSSGTNIYGYKTNNEMFFKCN